MSSRLKSIIQYLVILSITALLVWFSLRGLKTAEGFSGNVWEFLGNAWRLADKLWLSAMAVIAMLSHVVRAERWRMLILPSGHQNKLSHSFYSLMVGYLVNLVIPRGGEVSRCYNLYKLDKTPVEISFGTVVTERVIDVICLLALIALSFAVESKKLFDFVSTLPISFNTGGTGPSAILIILIVLLVIFVIAFVILKKNQRLRARLAKTFSGFKEGLLSIFKLKNKNLFIFYSLLIWVLYFLQSYAVVKAFPSTSVLGVNAVLSLFAIGAIAMAAPLPGGTGAYHVLVPQGLVFLYNIPKSDAIAFTFIFHGWQTLILIVGGAISLLLTSAIVKNKSAP